MAVIPNKNTKQARKILDKQGVTAVEYRAGDRMDRLEKANRAVEYFGDVRFKKQTDTKKTIKLSEKEKEYVSLVYGSEKQFQENIRKEAERVRSFYFREEIYSNNRQARGGISGVKKRTVLASFQEKGFIDFRGVKLNTRQDVADLYTLHRSPNIEKAHVVLLNNKNEVVKTEAITANRIDETVMFSYEHINKIATISKANSYYIVHNHPSGDPTPSSQDINATIDLSRNVSIEFKGHIIINDTKYSVINDKGNISFGDYTKAQQSLFSERTKINGTVQMAKLGEQILKRDNVSLAVFFLDSKMRISAYNTYPKDIGNDKLKNEIKSGIRNNLGGSYVVIYDGVTHNTFSHLPAGATDIIDIRNTENYSQIHKVRVDRQKPVTYRDVQHFKEDGNAFQLRFRKQDSPPLYSNTAKALEAIPMNKATAAQWKAMLEKNGASVVEMDWMELNTFFRNNPKPTKAQLQAHINKKTVDIVEVENRNGVISGVLILDFFEYVYCK